MGRGAPRGRGWFGPAFGAVVLLLVLAGSGSAASGGDRRRLPDLRIGPLQMGKTTEKEAVARLGEGLRYPAANGPARCWSEERRLLCAAFEKGRITALSLEKDATLPPRAQRFLRGPDGKKPLPPTDVLQAKLRPNLFLSSLATESGVRIESTEREVLAALGAPHVLSSPKPPFRFIYRSTRETDPACPGECTGVYTLSKELLISIYLRVE